MVWNSANCPNFCSFDTMVLEKEGISDTESQDTPELQVTYQNQLCLCVYVCVFLV